MSIARGSVVFVSVYLLSSVAMSNGSVAPELPILAQARSTAEYPVLRQIQDLTLELQMLELTIKNRRDSDTEEKISAAIKSIEDEGAAISGQFKRIHTEQLDAIYRLFFLGRHYGGMMGVAPSEWDELFASLKENTLTAGTLAIHARAGTLNLLSLTPLYIGKQLVWNISLPSFDSKSYWVQLRARARLLGVRTGGAFADDALEKRFAKMNEPFGQAEKLTKEYFNTSYAKLYSAFETQRYAILQRVQMARNALQRLERQHTAMGTPEEFSGLYNQVLDNLFSYGVDISLSGAQRDFAVKGFLFAESPEASEDLLRKLKFTPASSSSYNSPSS